MHAFKSPTDLRVRGANLWNEVAGDTPKGRLSSNTDPRARCLLRHAHDYTAI